MSRNRFGVCPHDTAQNADSWALFNTRINRHLGLGSVFHLYLDFAEFSASLAEGSLLYAYLNPADYVRAKDEHGYIAVGRPVGRFDNALLIGRADAGPFDGHTSGPLAVVPGYLATIALAELATEGIAAPLATYRSYAAVMVALRNESARFGITYNDHFAGTNAKSREGISVLREFHTGLSHVLAIHPSLAECAGRISDFLHSPEGAAASEPVGISAWESVPVEPYEKLRPSRP